MLAWGELRMFGKAGSAVERSLTRGPDGDGLGRPCISGLVGEGGGCEGLDRNNGGAAWSAGAECLIAAMAALTSLMASVMPCSVTVRDSPSSRAWSRGPIDAVSAATTAAASDSAMAPSTPYMETVEAAAGGAEADGAGEPLDGSAFASAGLLGVKWARVDR